MLAEAEALLEAHPLRTLDAVHVASARLFQKRMRVPVLFVTSDARQLTAAAREAIRVTREKFGQHFDGDVAIELGVFRAIHLARAARAEQRDDFTGAEARAGGQAQWKYAD